MDNWFAGRSSIPLSRGCGAIKCRWNQKRRSTMNDVEQCWMQELGTVHCLYGFLFFFYVTADGVNMILKFASSMNNVRSSSMKFGQPCNRLSHSSILFGCHHRSLHEMNIVWLRLLLLLSHLSFPLYAVIFLCIQFDMLDNYSLCQKDAVHETTRLPTTRRYVSYRSASIHNTHKCLFLVDCCFVLHRRLSSWNPVEIQTFEYGNQPTSSFNSSNYWLWWMPWIRNAHWPELFGVQRMDKGQFLSRSTIE